ncbi:Zinc finger CCCH domain-containing protein 24 [Ananas comosus]|uniref:Zinc finger CCCH domain-containing protein 24 n=1 Tax=Ananas comosus TaxID=4615 RepID=A0A199UUB3_ANACO|nr:Zinc finger CCCH domain-containing protein 24 [Ananas comosus]
MREAVQKIGEEEEHQSSAKMTGGCNNMKNHFQNLTIETGADAEADAVAGLLEFAADNDAAGLRRAIEEDPAAADEVGLWYGRRKGSNLMVLEHRTPLMVAATYGSLDAIALLVSLPSVDVNRRCGPDAATALHCAASGASECALDAVRLLLDAGADPAAADAAGLRPADVAVAPPMSPADVKIALLRLLGGDCRGESNHHHPHHHAALRCPFVHPGENARRRDPRKYHYSCVPCPDFRKGSCRRGDMCEYAHGVFECWLHPAQYRTRLCKDGTACTRRVCFFAHTSEELRPLYVSTGSAVPSPRSANSAAALEMAAAMGMMPGSPSSLSASNAPALHLPGSNLQLSRLRTSLSARDMPVDDLSMLPDFDAQLLNDLCYSHLSSPAANRSVRSKTLTPSNLDDLFSAEIAASSPRYNSDQAPFSPTHKTVMFNQFQQQQQSLLSPINTGIFPPKTSSFGISSPGLMSPRSMEQPVSPMGSRMAALAQREKQQQQQQQQQTLRSLSSRDLGSGTSLFVGSPVNSSPWAKWGSPSGAPDWNVNGEELGRLRRSSSFELRSNGEEPDLSWVQSLVKESPQEKLLGTASSEGVSNSNLNSNSNSQMEGHDQAAVLGAWLEQMQLDQMTT